jgi:hypothetical protein
MAPIHRNALPGHAIRPSLPTSLKDAHPPLPAIPQHRQPFHWLNNQPYLLLALASLFWAGNIVLARYVAGHVPPLTLSCLRWIGTFLMLLPFAGPHLKKMTGRSCAHAGRYCCCLR